MILSDAEIIKAIKNQEIIIDPPPELSQYTTSALDLMLGDEFKRLKTPEELHKDEPLGVHRPLIIDLAVVDILSLVRQYGVPCNKEEDGSYVLKPREFVLGITREYIELPKESKIAARVEGRSTLARLGLVVHLTAPTIHAGFKGRIVLEICNFGPYNLILKPGRLPICQLIFERLGEHPAGEIQTRFQEQKGLN